jgi:hypothetical protein
VTLLDDVRPLLASIPIDISEEQQIYEIPAKFPSLPKIPNVVVPVTQRPLIPVSSMHILQPFAIIDHGYLYLLWYPLKRGSIRFDVSSVASYLIF